jgi:hypothetical protein
MRTETKVLLNALATVRREPEDKILHDALLAYFAHTGREMQATHQVGGNVPEPVRPDTLPDRVRRQALQRHIEPARLRGDSETRIVVRDLHSELRLTQKYAIVMGALDSEAFRRMAGLCSTRLLTDSNGRKVVHCIF